MAYNDLNPELVVKIENDIANGTQPNFSANDESAIRRTPKTLDICRPNFTRDVEAILHVPYYNRYNDKTQVFSFYKNDDISRRGLHVQLVSRIARTIGKVLNLNLDLIEAIALGHDIGHTPFGHAGERFLNEIYHEKTGRFFNHNVHSVRVLDKILCQNLSLQTLSGIISHNGEKEKIKLYPSKLNKFDEFDAIVEKCYTKEKYGDTLIANTLEGCLVRLCDIIAYVGKDRQDAEKARITTSKVKYAKTSMGEKNAEIIKNFTIDIIENSYGKEYISMSEQAFKALKSLKSENYEKIYQSEKVDAEYNKIIKPMFVDLYGRLYDDLINKNENSPIFKHHIADVSNYLKITNKEEKIEDYKKENPHDIVVDYIASMTDDYFIDLHEFLFPQSEHKINYKSYFDDIL